MLMRFPLPASHRRQSPRAAAAAAASSSTLPGQPAAAVLTSTSVGCAPCFTNHAHSPHSYGCSWRPKEDRGPVNLSLLGRTAARSSARCRTPPSSTAQIPWGVCGHARVVRHALDDLPGTTISTEPIHTSPRGGVVVRRDHSSRPRHPAQLSVLAQVREPVTATLTVSAAMGHRS